MRTLSLLAACAVVLSTAGFTAAQAGPPTSQPRIAAADALIRGHAVFEQWCSGCHKPLPLNAAPPGPGNPFPPAGTYTLQKRYNGSLPAALEERTDLTPGLIRTMVRQGAGIMPPTRKSEVTDEDLDALIAYLTRKR